MSLFLAPNFRRATNPAQCSIFGSLANGVDLSETLTLVNQNGAQVTGVSTNSFHLNFRDRPNDTSLASTIGPGYFTIAEGATATTATISAPAGLISGLSAGDYVADLVSEDSVGSKFLHAHGRISIIATDITVATAEAEEAEQVANLVTLTTGNHTMNVNTDVLIIKKTIAAATQITMPLSSTYTRPRVYVFDWYGNAGDITFVATGADLFNNSATWTVTSSTNSHGSLELIPDPGVGWVVS